MKKFISIILMLGMLGCGHMSNKQKSLFSCMVVGHIADYGITIEKLRKQGAYEMNPVFSKANSESMLLGKLGLFGLMYGAGKVLPEHQDLIYGIGCGSGIGLTLWNFNQ